MKVPILGFFIGSKFNFYMAWFENIWPYLLYSMTLLVNNLFRHFYHFLKIVSHPYQTRARSKIDKNLILLVNTQFNSYCQTIGSTFQINDHAMALFSRNNFSNSFMQSLWENVIMEPIWYFRQIFYSWIFKFIIICMNHNCLFVYKMYSCCLIASVHDVWIKWQTD